MKYGLWMIFNFKSIKSEVTIDIDYEGEKVSLLITDYERAIKINEVYADWIEQKLVNPGGWIRARQPNPFDCLYVVTPNPCATHNTQKLFSTIHLALRMSLPTPIYISGVGEYIERAAITLPNWPNIPESFLVSKVVIEPQSFIYFENYLLSLLSLDKRYFPSIEQIYKISLINDVFLEVLSLWAFIEGFWNARGGESDLSESFLNMITKSLYPGSKKKDVNVQLATRKIDSQNDVLGAKTYSHLRNLIAHGAYLELLDIWNTKQIEAIYEQREHLLKLVYQSLVNYEIEQQFGTPQTL